MDLVSSIYVGSKESGINNRFENFSSVYVSLYCSFPESAASTYNAGLWPKEQDYYHSLLLHPIPARNEYLPSIFKSAQTFRQKPMWIFSFILANFINFYTLYKIAKNSTEVMPYTCYFQRFIWKMYECANSSKWPIF